MKLKTTERPPRKDPERRAWIKYQLELRGHNFAELAREHGLHRTCVRSALHRPYPKMERLIADKLGLRPEDIWPERYEDCAHHKGRGRRAQ